jgi:hypothetical protein
MDQPPQAGLRLGGRHVLATGETVVWSIADGRRGRRWRELTIVDGVARRSILFEMDPAGEVSRLEIGSAAGLLTLHPVGRPAAIHGNLVSAAGIRHLSFPGEAGTVLVVDGSPASDAIVLGRPELAGLAVGAGRRFAAFRVDERLDPEPVEIEITRLETRSWRWTTWPTDGPPSTGPPRTVRLGADGLVELADGARWPLEPVARGARAPRPRPRDLRTPVTWTEGGQRPRSEGPDREVRG